MDGDIININDRLSEVPSKHTIIMIKEKLKCANTLQNKQNIGVMIERWKEMANDSLVIQGLLGRCCGYLNHDIICYTNIDTIKKYEDLFDSRFAEEDLDDICWNSNTTIGSKTGGTRSKPNINDAGERIPEIEEEIIAANLAAQQKKDQENAEKEAKRAAKDEEKLNIKPPSINSFKNQAEAKEYYNKHLKPLLEGRGPNKRVPDESGFYLSTIGKGTDRTRVRTVEEITAVSNWALDFDSHRYTIHPCYEKIDDKETIWWILSHNLF